MIGICHRAWETRGSGSASLPCEGLLAVLSMALIVRAQREGENQECVYMAVSEVHSHSRGWQPTSMPLSKLMPQSNLDIPIGGTDRPAAPTESESN